MAKLFLIRRNMETFAGPMTLVEMKEAHQRMQFGLSDEVSGHCGPWVQFDDLSRIKKHYPDIARIVHEQMLAGWGVSDHTGARIIGRDDTKKLQVKSQRSIGLALTFLVIALVAFAAAVYMASAGNKFSGKLGPQKEPVVEDAQASLARDPAEFDRYMDENGEAIVQQVNLQKKFETSWLPYLRLYAYNHEGQLAGIQPKTLRGQAAASAPSDCSLRAWRNRWRKTYTQWNGLVVERKFVRSHWARMLAWDPHWIRRRDNKGWIGSQNYYTACLTMADRALAEMSADTSLVKTASDWEHMGFPRVRQRLTWILEMARDGKSLAAPRGDASNPLGIWTCMEAARDLPTLNKCREGLDQSGAPEDFLAYTEERFGWNALRIMTKQGGPLAPDQRILLEKVASKASKEDFYTRFDYRAEQKLLKTLAKPQQADGTTPPPPIEKVVEKLSTEFPDVRLAH